SRAILCWLFAALTLFLTACDMGAVATPTLLAPTPTTAPTPTVPAATPTAAAFPVVTPDPVNAPARARDSVLYQIFVRAFTTEGPLAAAENRLPDLKDMGVTLVYLMPIHPIGKVNRKGSLGSPYSVADYTAIDPALGTEADLKSFVDEAHSLGMHVIMDLVA